MIFHPVTYYDDKGQHIIHNVIDEGLPPSDFPLFLGVGYIQIMTPLGPNEHKIEIPIPAKDLNEAFAKFSDVMEQEGPKKVEEFKKAMEAQARAFAQKQASRIITPSGSQPIPSFKGIMKD